MHEQEIATGAELSGRARGYKGIGGGQAGLQGED